MEFLKNGKADEALISYSIQKLSHLNQRENFLKLVKKITNIETFQSNVSLSTFLYGCAMQGYYDIDIWKKALKSLLVSNFIKQKDSGTQRMISTSINLIETECN